MGVTKVTAAICDLNKTKTPYEALFLVDTGATECMAPRSELIKSGITVRGKETYELANGDSYEAEYGYAIISFIGYETVVVVIFGPENTEPILGVVALENVGIAVDPRTHTLRKIHAKPLKTYQN